MSAELIRAAGMADDALGELRKHNDETLALKEPKLEAKLKVLARVVKEGVPFRYELAEFHQLAFDVAMLRDRREQITAAQDLIDKRLRKGHR